MKTKPIIKTMNRGCYACPSEWYGRLEDGRDYYIRYRFGLLECQCDATWWDTVTEDDVSLEIGGKYDGTMSTEEMIEHLQAYLDFGSLNNTKS